MEYDPSRTALFRPEAQPPLVMDATWPFDAICAEFSRLAYVRFDGGQGARTVIEEAVGRIGFGQIGYFDDGREVVVGQELDPQGFGAIDAGGHAIVAFRGTQADSRRDLLLDANILPSRWAGAGWVHGGFWKGLQAILPQVEAWLAGQTIARLTITGHSLGGALATLFTGLRPDAELVTFGSPRVGNTAFAAAFAGRPVRRYVDTLDIVAGVPPSPYKHLAGQRYIDPGGAIHETEKGASIADIAKANRDYAAAARNRANVPLRHLADHAPINYVAALLGGRTGP